MTRTPTEADVEDVARELGRNVSPEAVEQFAAMQRLVAIARARGNDCGRALLAGLYLGEGMSENEIVARIWPRQQRFRVVKD